MVCAFVVHSQNRVEVRFEPQVRQFDQRKP